MNGWEWAAPASLDEALTLLDPEDAAVRPVAGGTALWLLMKAKLFRPRRLVSLHRLSALQGIERTPAGDIRIGAMTPLRELERTDWLREAVPALAGALPHLSNVRVRSVARLGGHLAHGDPHMDLPPLLIALGAQVEVVGPQGSRRIPLEALYVGYYQTVLARNELITGVEIPAAATRSAAAYQKATALTADDWPAAGIAVAWQWQDGRLQDVRVAVSAAVDRPQRLPAAEAELTGYPPDPARFARAAEAAAATVQPLSDIRGSAAYKRELVRVLVRRGLAAAHGR